MNHIIVLHARDKEEIDAIRDRDLLTHDIRYVDLKDGFLATFRTNDYLLRHRLAAQDGITVFPHVFSSIGITQAEADLIGHGARVGDTMETALLKVDDAYDHFRLHPHSL